MGGQYPPRNAGGGFPVEIRHPSGSSSEWAFRPNEDFKLFT